MAINGPTDTRDAQQRMELSNRYLFTGKLVMQTALHIGGGTATLSSSDSPVVLTPDQKPYIPGSSFKGALRSTVEKLAANLPGVFSTCSLIELSEHELNEELRRGKKKSEICSTARRWDIYRRRQQQPTRADEITREAVDERCDTCKLFGSPFAAARVNVSDLYLLGDEWSGILQTRDGVAIDRDSEKAKDRLKYDFEVVPASAVFDLQLVMENATRKDVQLLCIGLSEFVHGFGVVGGKRSRGLGVAKLDGLRVAALELFREGVDEQQVDEGKRRERLRQYLIGKDILEKFPSPVDGALFLKEYVESIFK